VTETPIELDKHRGMAAQKATDIRRVIADVEANAKPAGLPATDTHHRDLVSAVLADLTRLSREES
jgi:hypothetical protein